MQPFAIMYVTYLAVLTVTSWYIHHNRKNIDDMHGMMVGMTVGMMAGLATGTLYLISTGHFLNGVIFGSSIGLVFGLFLGRLGGHLGIVEGIIAGPMGGMMGAMLGQMIRPYNINIFMPFFTTIFTTTLLGLIYAVHCGVSCCGKQQKKNFPHHIVITGLIISIFLIGISVILPFEPEEQEQKKQTDLPDLPRYLQNLIKEEQAEAVQKDSYQEASIHSTQSRYSPNVILAKKGIPLKIHLTADETAGCARDLIIPDFNIRHTIKQPTTIELLPQQEGTYPFRCAMDMARGKIIVQ